MRIIMLLSLLFIWSCQSSSDTADAPQVATHTSYKVDMNSKGKHIVLVSGDEEYRSEEALPQLAKILSQHHGFDCTVLYAQDPQNPGIIDPNYNANIPGMEKLEQADLMVLFTRFRALPEEQMQHFENYLLEGKPLLAIRTSTHAFNYEDKNHPFAHYSYNYDGDKADWKWGFGKRILGETWYTHHGQHKHQSTRGVIAPEAEGHPIVNGIEDGAIWGATDVYGIRMPIGGDAKHILLGQTIDREGAYDETDLLYGMKESDQNIATVTQQGNQEGYNPNEPMPPIVWTKSYQLPNGKQGQSVTSTIGAATDMLDEDVRRMMVNTAYYLLNIEVPEKANVDLVGQYSPSAFQFHNDEHWEKKSLKVE